ANIEFVDVICEHGVEPFARTCSVHDQLSHVRNVEDPDIFPHGLMFVDDACVLHRHEPSSEGNHSRAELNMFFVKWRFFWRTSAHASKLDCTTARASIPEIPRAAR